MAEECRIDVHVCDIHTYTHVSIARSRKQSCRVQHTEKEWWISWVGCAGRRVRSRRSVGLEHVGVQSNTGSLGYVGVGGGGERGRNVN